MLRAKTRERNLAAWFRQHVDKIKDRPYRYDRVESFISRGFSDVVFTVDGITRFIEFKTCSMPARATSRLRFVVRAAQIQWHDAFCAASLEPSYFVVQIGSGSGAPRIGIRWPDLRPSIDVLNSRANITFQEMAAAGFDAQWFFSGKVGPF